jgi:hypothetical protein
MAGWEKIAQARQKYCKIVSVCCNPGERAVQHVETMFPLWFCQKALLDILTEDCREKHRQYANANPQRREFLPGDIVVIRQQIQSDASTGRPAKL